MKIEFKLPCTGCKFNTHEDDDSVLCDYLVHHGSGDIPLISDKNVLEGGLERVPKGLFMSVNSTCAAKHCK